MTPRQLHHFISAIDRVKAIEFYNRMALLFKVPRMKELSSLEEFLALLSNKPTEVVSNFDAETDAKLEAYALKKLHEGRRAE